MKEIKPDIAPKTVVHTPDIQPTIDEEHCVCPEAHKELEQQAQALLLLLQRQGMYQTIRKLQAELSMQALRQLRLHLISQRLLCLKMFRLMLKL